jgi:phage gp29-like protein
MNKPSEKAVQRARALLARGAKLVAAGHEPEAVAGAVKRLVFAAAKPQRFDARQDEVENLADDAIRMAGQPIDPVAIQRAIRASTSQDDLLERLAVLFDTVPASQYRETVERALFVADVLGYVHEDERARGG